MKYLTTALLAMCAVIACSRSAPSPEEADDPEPLSVTRWTARTELFAEYPALVAGRTSRFAIHLTRLDTFKPLTAGRVEVHLRGERGAPEVFVVDRPSRPGIFGVDVRPTRPGARALVVVLRADGIEDEHRVGEVQVHRDAAAAQAGTGGDSEGGEGISFLKEQQWALDFGTALIHEQAVRESVRVPAQIVPRPGGSADVVAPVDGRLTVVRDVAPGTPVTNGQELGRLMPPPSVPGELPQLQQARAEAAASHEFALRDRERAERLVTAGAAPQKRLEEARVAETQAAARVRAAAARLARYHAARTGAGGTASEDLFVVRAPLTGIIARRTATTGANISAGSVLFQIVDASQVHVLGHVPEADAIRAQLARLAEIELPGRSQRVPAGRLATIGQVLDPQSRTLPITFALDNRGLRLPVGQAVFLHLLFDPAAPRPVVPATAIVDDAGRPIVFVQREGELFERRPVTVGARSGDTVQILDGVRPGERVVMKGAYLVRLASLSTQVPAHGHVH